MPKMPESVKEKLDALFAAFDAAVSEANTQAKRNDGLLLVSDAVFVHIKYAYGDSGLLAVVEYLSEKEEASNGGASQSFNAPLFNFSRN